MPLSIACWSGLKRTKELLCDHWLTLPQQADRKSFEQSPGSLSLHQMTITPSRTEQHHLVQIVVSQQCASILRTHITLRKHHLRQSSGQNCHSITGCPAQINTSNNSKRLQRRTLAPLGQVLLVPSALEKIELPKLAPNRMTLFGGLRVTMLAQHPLRAWTTPPTSASL